MAGPSSLVTTDPRSTAPVFYGAAMDEARRALGEPPAPRGWTRPDRMEL